MTDERFMREPEVERKTGLSRTTRWRLEQAGQFPHKRKLSQNAVGWLASEIETWMAERVEASAVPTKIEDGAEGQITALEAEEAERDPRQSSVDGEEQVVSLTVASGLYRILQEAMANVLKHARASEVKVAIAFEPAAVSITVADNGNGFDEGNHPGGYGLANMRERAEEMGGEFQITSAPGEGTSVQVTLPLGEEDDGSH